MFYLVWHALSYKLPAMFGYISFRAIFASLSAFVIVMVFMPIFIRLDIRKKIGQVIRSDGPAMHASKSGTPTMGGIVFSAATIFSSFLWSNIANRFVLLLMMATMFGAGLGFLDDYQKIYKKTSKGISAKTRVVAEIIFAIFILFLLHKIYISNHFAFSTDLFFPITKLSIDLGAFYFIFDIFVIVGSANAVNLTDGLDGLATGLSLAVIMVFVVASYLAGNLNFATYLRIPHIIGAGEITVYLASLFGSLLGFLWYNCYPAEVFMGDTGSLAIGSVMGISAVMIKDELLLAVVGIVFVAETVSVILQVSNFKLTKKRIFLMAPLHHHFELKGWKEPKVIVRFWIIGLIIAIFGLVMFKIR